MTASKTKLLNNPIIMKKIYLILFFLTSLLGYSQADPQPAVNGARTINIKTPTPITISGTPGYTNATENGKADGSLSIMFQGGTSDYVYIWAKDGQPYTPASWTSLPAGNYVIYAKDKTKICRSADFSFTIYQPEKIIVSTPKPTNIPCPGGTGTLTASAVGGYPYSPTPIDRTYDYTWYSCDASGNILSKVSGPSTNASISGQIKGYYKVVVADSKGNTSAGPVVLLEPNPQIQSTVTSKKDVSCYDGNDGEINISLSGGTGTLTVLWNDGGAGANRTGLKKGDYWYTVKDANNCSYSNSIITNIGQPTAALAITKITQTQPTSSTATDGTITVTATGGTAPYTYVWTKNGQPFGANTNGAGLTTGLGNGNYHITVIDAKGCNIPSGTVELKALTVALQDQTNIKCKGLPTGSITVVASGGTLNTATPDYKFQWLLNGTEIPGKESATLSGILKGDYTVKVTDANNTILSPIYTISEPAAILTITNSTAQRRNVSCNGGTDGAIDVTVSGGTGAYNYVWSNGSTASRLSNVPVGTYWVAVTDENGCPARLDNIVITQPNPIIVPTPAIKNVAIFGQNTGSIIFPADPTGGTLAYQYNWTRAGDPTFPRTTRDITALKAGTYHLEIRDANANAADNAGCIVTRDYTVNETDLLEVQIKETQFIKCNGDSNGQLTALVKGGIAPYKYVWKKNGVVLPLETKSEISGIAVGQYSVSVTDSANPEPAGPFAKAEQLNYKLDEPNELQVKLTGQTNVLCFGAATGAIDITISGGTGPYTQQWTKNGVDYSTADDLANLTIGTYKVTVKDRGDHGCMATLDVPVVITQPAAPLKIESATPIDLTGFETKNGSIAVVVSGGKPNYSYEWTKDTDAAIIGSTSSIGNLAIGTYHLIVRDANGCSLPKVDYEITQPAKFEIISITQTPNTNVACYGDSPAEFTAVVTGGVKEYTFEWLNTTTGVKHNHTEDIKTSSTSSKASNLGAGNYIITVKDKENNVLFGTNTFTISQPDKLAFTFTKTDVSCHNGNNGTVRLNITGGTKFTDITKPYTIVSSGIIDTQNGIISGLTKGDYKIRLIDANGCQTAEQTVTITEPLKAVFIDTKVVRPTTGFGLATGKIAITVGGGTAGYKYQWKDSSNNTVGTDNPVLNNVPAGIYTVLVTDAKLCTITDSYTIEQPTKPVLTETHLQARCNGLSGSLNAVATGGAAFNQNQADRTYTYKLRNKTTAAVVTIISNTADFTNIPDGDYTLTATDNGGVDSNTIDVTFKQPTAVVVKLTSKVNVSCFAGQDGAIAISVTGGTPFIINGNPVYNYQWKKRNTVTNTYENFTPVSLDALIEGDYAVEVRDANYNPADDTHCIGILENIIITQPADFGFDIDKITYINPTAQNGNDGALHFEIVGGKANYEYKLYTKDAQENITVLKTISNTPLKMVDFTGLVKDHYYVSVQDNTGCTKYTDFDFTDNPLIISISQTQDMTCFESNNAIIKATVAGGFGTKKISWYQNNILLPNENNTELINVKIGSYYAVVKDSKAIEVTTTPIIITQPNLVTFTTIQEPVKCLGDSNGTISITATGGNGIFRYRYFKNGTMIKDWNNFSNGTKTVLTDLSDGEYSLQVQDTQQCKSTDAIVKITSPTALILTNVTATPATGKGLNNGSLAITAQGANGNYTYDWFKSDGTSLNQTAATAVNLPAGKYYIVIKDAKACSLTSQLLEVTEPALLETSIEVQNVVLCNGDQNGSLKPTSVGGFLKPGENYTYQWFAEGNTTVLATTTLLTGIGKGSYYVIATDSNGNKATSKVLVVTEPQILNNVLTSDYTLCGDFNDWTINATPSGGTLPYTYIWNTGAQTATINNVPPGYYAVKITDKHGCTISKDITIVAPVHLAASEVIKIPTCYAGSDATITLTASGGKAPYTYLWNTGEKSNALSNVAAGDYTVAITDSKGCVINHNYTIINPAKDIINIGEDVTLCFDQTLTINATIDDDKATYSWTSDKGFKSNKAMVTVSEPANYTVVVTNKLGCEATDTIKISSQSTPISAEFAVSSQVFKNEKFIIVDISNPDADEIEWVLPANATVISKNKDFAEISFSQAGEYDITLNTKKGDCTAFQTKQVLVTEGEYEENNPDNETLKKFDLKIYPNPSKGAFTVDVLLDKVMPAHVKIYNLNNNLLIDSKTQDGKDNYLFNFSLNGLPSGVYFVLFESQQGSKLRKIIIQ